MRQKFQQKLLTENNHYIKSSNSNLYQKSKIRPITTNNNLENPIRINNKRLINSKLTPNSTNYSFFSKIKKNNSYNKSIILNKKTTNLSKLKNLSYNNLNSDNNSKGILPLISKTESNDINEIKVSPAEKYKKKLENIINMFKNEPDNKLFLKKKFKFKHRGLIPGVPDDLFSRLKFNHEIFKNQKFIEYVEGAPPRKKNDIEEITDYLWDYSKNHNLKINFYAIFFYYLCTNIQYDVEKINERESNLNKIFDSGYANSLQFCKLFEFMCKRHFLKIKRIEGFCKTKEYPYYKKGMDVSVTNHYWNSIYINNTWYLCDLTFGSGGIKPKEVNSNPKDYFNPYYFLTPPECLIITHRPLNDEWQMTSKIIPANQFSNKSDINMGDFYKQVYEHSLELITHKFPIIKCNKNLKIQIGIKNAATQAFLYFSNYKTKSTEIKTEFDQDNNILNIEHNFDMNGKYWLQILYREDNSTDIKYMPLINYKIIVDDSEEKYFENLKKNKKIKLNEKLLFDFKWKKSKKLRGKNLSGILVNYEQLNTYRSQNKICLDNEGAYLISPNAKNIKIGQINEFKVKAPNCDVVCVLDGHNWNYLKRNKNDKNIWFGKIEIKNENIMILSMKNNKVFTEIFRLKAHYTISNLLRLSQEKKNRSKSSKKSKK